LDGPSDASLEDHKSNRRDGHVKKRILRVHVAILLLSRFTNQEEAASAAVCKGLVAEGVER
jgi:hypothetical protein